MRLRAAFERSLEKGVRRHVCFSCVSFFLESEVEPSHEAWDIEDLTASANYRHLAHVKDVYPNLRPVMLVAAVDSSVVDDGSGEAGRRHVLLCRELCAREWEDEGGGGGGHGTARSSDGGMRPPALSRLARGLRPYSDVPDELKVLRPLEAGRLSCLEFEVNLGGALVGAITGE